MLVIEDEIITSTRAKELLVFAKPRLSKYDFKKLKEAIRLGTVIPEKE
jgi:hypothetical protein